MAGVRERLATSQSYQMAQNQSLSSNPTIAAKGQAELQRMEQLAFQQSNGGGGSPAAPPAFDPSQWSVKPK